MRSPLAWLTAFDKLRSEDPEVARQAVEQVDRLGNLAVPRLRHMLGKTSDPITTRNVLRVLGRLRKPSRRTTYNLYTYLTHSVDEVAGAARDALSHFPNDPFAAAQVRAYDACQESNRFFDRWYGSDPARAIYYVGRFLPVSDTKLWARCQLLASVHYQAVGGQLQGYLAGVPVRVIDSAGEYEELEFPPLSGESYSEGHSIRNEVSYNGTRCLFSFASPGDREVALARLPGFFTYSPRGEYEVRQCSGQILLGSWADYPDAMAYQSINHGYSYTRMAIRGEGMMVLPENIPGARDPARATEGPLRDKARQKAPKPGDTLVFNGIADRSESAYGVMVVGMPMGDRPGHYRLTVCAPSETAQALAPRDLLYRKLFWREQPLAFGSAEPYHAIHTALVVRITGCRPA